MAAICWTELNWVELEGLVPGAHIIGGGGVGAWDTPQYFQSRSKIKRKVSPR